MTSGVPYVPAGPGPSGIAPTPVPAKMMGAKGLPEFADTFVLALVELNCVPTKSPTAVSDSTVKDKTAFRVDTLFLVQNIVNLPPHKFAKKLNDFL